MKEVIAKVVTGYSTLTYHSEGLRCCSIMLDEATEQLKEFLQKRIDIHVLELESDCGCIKIVQVSGALHIRLDVQDRKIVDLKYFIVDTIDNMLTV